MALFVFLLFLLFLQSAAASDLISVKSGDDVTLPCRAVGVSIRAVEWTRTDLDSESEYVYIYTDGRSDPTNQHPSFKGRVQLVDNDLKDGNVSLILKKVNMNDTGTYECRVYQGSVLDKNPVRRFILEVADLISVKSGGDVILSCRADGGNIRTVEWTRTDLKSEYVLFYRDGNSDPTNQHPSFKGRVQLVDNDLKDGDVSLILKNVNKNDTGTYKCRVYQGSVLDENPVRRFILEVAESGNTAGKAQDEGNMCQLVVGLFFLFLLNT